MKLMTVGGSTFIFLEQQRIQRPHVVDHLMVVEDEYEPSPRAYQVRCLCGWHSRSFAEGDKDPNIFRNAQNHSMVKRHPIWKETGYYEIG